MIGYQIIKKPNTVRTFFGSEPHHKFTKIKIIFENLRENVMKLSHISDLYYEKALRPSEYKVIYN